MALDWTLIKGGSQYRLCDDSPFNHLMRCLMTLLFPSEAWLQAFADEVNKNEEYQEAAKDWEGDFYFIIEPEGQLKERTITYMDLWHGQCRSACIITNEADKNPEFRMRAPIGTWKKVFEKKLNPIQGMLVGQLKVSGNMMKIVKSPRAALALVNCCSRIPTSFPVK